MIEGDGCHFVTHEVFGPAIKATLEAGGFRVMPMYKTDDEGYFYAVAPEALLRSE